MLVSEWMMWQQVVVHGEVGVVEGTGKDFGGCECLVCHATVFHWSRKKHQKVRFVNDHFYHVKLYSQYQFQTN